MVESSLTTIPNLLSSWDDLLFLYLPEFIAFNNDEDLRVCDEIYDIYGYLRNRYERHRNSHSL